MLHFALSNLITEQESTTCLLRHFVERSSDIHITNSSDRHLFTNLFTLWGRLALSLCTIHASLVRRYVMILERMNARSPPTKEFLQTSTQSDTFHQTPDCTIFRRANPSESNSRGLRFVCNWNDNSESINIKGDDSSGLSSTSSDMFSSLSKALLVLATALYANAAQSTLQQQTGNWGSNPTNVGFFYYKPLNLPANPALIVAMHYCSGTAQAFFTGTQYANLADTYKYIVIYPNAPDSGGCWDVHTTATLTHNGGGDSIAIANMVRFAISSWGVDASRVYMTGLSSGAMMTNVLAGAYPDLFKAGSAFAGVPYGCFAGPDMWNTPCATGQTTKTAQEWVSVAVLSWL